jgi:hypothetical protein
MAADLCFNPESESKIFLRNTMDPQRAARYCELLWKPQQFTGMPLLAKILALNYWRSGPCLSSGIQESREHDVSDTESVSVLR